MMMTAFDSKSFKRLYAIWNAKLKASGFNDVEDSSEDRRLKVWHSHYFRHRVGIERQEASKTYYEAARALCHAYKFDNPTHKKIWELHSEGWPRRQIQIAIAHFEISYKQAQIGEIIKKIAKAIK